MNPEQIIDIYESTKEFSQLDKIRFAMLECERHGVHWTDSLVIILRHAKEQSV